MSTHPPVSTGDLFIFYGLLKQGATGMPDHIDLEAAGEFLDTCRFKGELYDLGGFPGAVDGKGLCYGILYRLDDTRIVEALDAFEDVVDDPEASLYVRKKVPILSDLGTETGEEAWIYWYNRAVSTRPRVPNDDWPLTAGRTRK